MKMTKEEIAHNALRNAVEGQSFANYPAIIEGFAAKGIPVEEIRPRENVFTYNAWHALGRFVRKGEHGVRVATRVEYEVKDKETGEVERRSRPSGTTVFHVSQTDEAAQRGQEAQS